MSKHRLCLNCGKKTSLIKTILFNKCCSYKCDCIYEKKRDEKEREDWEQLKKERSFKRVPILKHDGADTEYIKTEEILDVNPESDIDEFYNYCLTDDNPDDYNF